VFAKQLSLMASLFLLPLSITSLATDTELAVGKTQEGNLHAGKSQPFVATLNAEDLAVISFDPHGKELEVGVYGPSGNRFRGATLEPGPANFTFIAERPGAYRIEVSTVDKTIDGTFTITLQKVVTLSARLSAPKLLPESPRINALRDSVMGGNPQRIDAFWKEVEQQGAPIIEPLPGDVQNMLVTFLWRGSPDTHNVFVIRLPYAAGAPDDYFMDRLGDTSLWYKTVVVGRKARFEYSLAPNVPRIRPISGGIDSDAIALIAAAARPDPLNPKRWRFDPQSADSPEFNGTSMVEMPGVPAQPWLAERPGVPAGHIEKRRVSSALLNNEREIAIYLPPGYSKTDKLYPLLVLFDELAYLGDRKQTVLVPTPTILDNLISAKRIPAVVALLVGNAAGARDRDLACNPEFSNFLSSELLPWAHGLYNLTADPKQTIVAGSSRGGLAAACAGLHHSETFGNVLSQSGSFWWVPTKNDSSSGSGTDSEPNWVARQFIASPKLPLRFYLDAGNEEIDLTGSGGSILLNNRTLRDVLRAKGYDVYFQEFAGGHDYLSWRGTLADGLMVLLGDGPMKQMQELPPKGN
jgi:enterochelin esterase family protein